MDLKMENQDQLNYNRIAAAIDYIKENFREQPNLDEVAEKINVSPFHFQRMFTDWAGVSPKKFLQFLNVEYSKSLLKTKSATLFDVAEEAGLSGTGRLHDLFVSLEGMTPGEYKNGGEYLSINYSFSETLFGTVLVASTPKGICKLAFSNNETDVFQELKDTFPNASFYNRSDKNHEIALSIFQKDWSKPAQIKLHLKGTDFQVKVWQALLKIPEAQLVSYGNIAHSVGTPKASRAVGSAIGDNPIAFIIPCHRVVQSTGSYGQYRWGSTRKKMMIGWEASRLNSI
jgi:AraC family transcriptional regulator of adaptative response/methylated-DNA-[protein]-cysteine methyltransferase